MLINKRFTTITTLSKIIAAVIFITFPFIGFFLGVQYGKNGVIIQQPLNTSNEIVPTETETKNESVKILEVEAPLPTIRVVSPNGGGRFCVGENLNIDWDASDELETIMIAISRPGSEKRIGSYQNKFGVAVWKPTIGSINETSKVRVYSRYNNEIIEDFSDSVFAIELCEG